MKFEYHAKNPDDHILSGEIDASDLQEANVLLRAQSLQPIRVTKLKNKTNSHNFQLTEQELYEFFSCYVTFHDLNLEDREIIRIIQNQTDSRRLQMCCKEILTIATDFQSMGTVICQFPKYFNEVARSIGDQLVLADDGALQIQMRHVCSYFKKMIAIDVELNKVSKQFIHFLTMIFLTIGLGHISLVIFQDRLTEVPDFIKHMNAQFQRPVLTLASVYTIVIFSLHSVCYSLNLNNKIFLFLSGRLRFKFNFIKFLTTIEFLQNIGFSYSEALRVSLAQINRPDFYQFDLRQSMTRDKLNYMKNSTEFDFMQNLNCNYLLQENKTRLLDALSSFIDNYKYQINKELIGFINIFRFFQIVVLFHCFVVFLVSLQTIMKG